MPDDHHDQRKSQRHYFAPEEEMVGIFFIQKLDKRFTFKIANISNGGLNFSIERDSNVDLLKGGQIFLEEIKGKADLCFTCNIALSVRWILDEKTLSYIGFGCQFIDLPEPLSKQISTFAVSEAAKNTR